jgi:hypothetical protein
VIVTVESVTTTGIVTWGVSADTATVAVALGTAARLSVPDLSTCPSSELLLWKKTSLYDSDAGAGDDEDAATSVLTEGSTCSGD